MVCIQIGYDRLSLGTESLQANVLHGVSPYQISCSLVF